MKVFFLTNIGFTGDNNQLKGIQSAVQAKIKEEVEFIEMEESHLDINTLDEGDIILVSGSHGLLKADEIKISNPGTKIIWSGHQYFSELTCVSNIPDIVALPETAVSESEKASIDKRTKLVLTTGVAHSVNATTVAIEHAKFKGELPDNKQFSRQIGIILAGDAPTADGQMKFFTEDDARNQAALIAMRLKANGFDTNQTAILITNGPRTGKHDPVTGQAFNPEPHRSNQIDSCSQAFLDLFKEEMSQSCIFFYDFQFSDLKFGPSAYKPMIKQVSDSQTGFWFVPAESTSMVTESSYFLESKTPVVIYHPSSENSVHLAHTQDAVKQGFAIDVANEDISFTPSEIKMGSAATKIAEIFYQDLVLTAKSSAHLVSATLFNTVSDSSNSIIESQADRKTFK